jgi:hypothetical protein
MTQPQPPAEPMVDIYVVNGTRTSQGPGPGPMTLPVSEANALLTARLAVYGERAPNEPEPEPTVRTFPHVPIRGSTVAASNG